MTKPAFFAVNQVVPLYKSASTGEISSPTLPSSVAEASPPSGFRDGSSSSRVGDMSSSCFSDCIVPKRNLYKKGVSPVVNLVFRASTAASAKNSGRTVQALCQEPDGYEPRGGDWPRNIRMACSPEEPRKSINQFDHSSV
ncbi:hypothetical protein KEM48_012912 [Puccinia striiformis f. sp. tritici PST-130]|nr:hypothetical protein KEM48_012912 [Puccinia striiformis f. sp. tritici PST-130]